MILPQLSLSGQAAELHWSPSGDALLAFIETEVDETGLCYFGSTKLVYWASVERGLHNATGCERLTVDGVVFLAAAVDHGGRLCDRLARRESLTSQASHSVLRPVSHRAATAISTRFQ